MAIQFKNLVDVFEQRTGAVASDAYTLTVSTEQTSGATPNPGTGGLKVQYYSVSSGTTHGFGLVAGSSSSDFLTSGPMHFYTNSDLDTVSATGFAMVLDNNQRLGIGTTSPTYKLDVQATGTADLANFETTGTAGIRIANSNTSFVTRITSGNNVTNFKSDGNIKFFTDGTAPGTERMVIENSTGDVGIGVSTPDTRLHIKDDAANNVAKFETVGLERSSISFKTDAATNNVAYLIFSTPADGRRRVALGQSNNPGSKDVLKIERQILPNYTSANMNFGGPGVGNSNKFSLQYDYDTDQDSNFNGFHVDANLSGTTALTGDRTVTGINVDMDSTATGGNTAQELTLKGVNVDVLNKTDGDAHHVYGVFAKANSIRTGAGDNISDITGGYFQAINSAQTGQVSDMYGTYSYALLEDATHITSNVYGSFSRAVVNNNFDGTISTKVAGSRVTAHLDDSNNNLVPRLIGADVENIIDSNLAISEGVNVVKDINNNLTITDSYLFKGKVEKPASSTITNNWGLYLEDVDKNYLEGTLRLPTYGQGNVTGTATKNLAVDSNGNVIETDGSIIDGSGTANYVAKWSDPNTLTDSVIYDNGTNVGIGTTNPTSKLEVAGNGKFVNGSTPITLEIGAGSSFVNQTYSTLKLAQGGGNFHRFQGRKSSDEEGSEYIMEEYTDNNELVRKTNSYDGDTYHVLYGSFLSLLGNSTNIYNGNIIEINEYIDHTGDDNTRFGFPANDTFAVDTAGSERMRINSTGRVGIATTNPLHRLQIGNGSGSESLQVSSASLSALYLSTPNSTAQSVIGFGNDQFATINTRGRILYQSNTAPASNYMQFTVAFNEVMRLTNDYLGIGTTNPQAKLHVNGDNFLVTNGSEESININTLSYVYKIGDIDGGESGSHMEINSVYADTIFHDTNVGIGVDLSPRTKLDINGPLSVIGGTFTSGTSGADSSASTGIVLRRGKKIFSGIPSGGNQDFYLRNLIEQDDGNNINIGQTGTGLINNISLNTGTSGNVIFRTTNSESVRINSSGRVGIGTTNPQSKLQVNGAVQVANDTATASASKVGALRYRTSGNNSYVDMCMQTGTSTYAWVNIVQNSW